MSSVARVDSDLVANMDVDGLLAIWDIHTGKALYRFKYDVQRKVEALSEGQLAVFDDTGVDFWSFYSNDEDLVASLDKHIGFQGPIVSVQMDESSVFVVEESQINEIGMTELEIMKTSKFPYRFQSVKLARDLLSRRVIIFGEETRGGIVVMDFDQNIVSKFEHCSLDSLEVFASFNIKAVCNNQVVYQLDAENFHLEKIDSISGKHLISPDINAQHFVDDTSLIKSIESVGNNIKIVHIGETVYVYNLAVSETKEVFTFKVPSTLSINDKPHHFIINKEGLEVYSLVASDNGIVDCYFNGIKIWTQDQSLSHIKGEVVITDRRIFPKVIEPSSGILDGLIDIFAKIYQLANNIHSNGDPVAFGFNKLLLVLTVNDKIGVFKLAKSHSQLIKIIDLKTKIDSIEEVDNEVYLLNGGNIFKFDWEKETVTPLNVGEARYPLFELKKIDQGFTCEVQDDKLSGIFYQNGSSIRTWSKAIEGKFVSLVKRSYDNTEVAQNAIELTNKEILYKYLIPNLNILITHKGKELVIDLINITDGSKIAQWKKEFEGDVSNVLALYEENYIILSLPYQNRIDESELVVIDLYESLTPNERITNLNLPFDNFESIPLPAFAMQSFIIGDIIDNMVISRTKQNISQRLLLLQIRGDIHVVPKLALDGRRGGIVGDFKSSEDPIFGSIGLYNKDLVHPVKYDALLKPSPKKQLTQDLDIMVDSSNSSLFTVPTNLESTSYVISITKDIFVSMIQPSGSFDKLTIDFKSNIVILVTIILLALIGFFKIQNSNKIKWVI